MDATLRKLVGFAQGGDMQRRSAAILMLGELGADEPSAVDAVRSALESGNAVLRDFALDYAEKVGPAALLPQIVPLLGDPDSAARDKADRVLVASGRAGIDAAAAVLPRLEGRQRNEVAGWVARQQGKKPLDALVRLLGSDDLEAVTQAARALAGACVSADEVWRTSVAERLAPLLTRDVIRSSEAAYLAILDLASVVGRPELRAALVQAIEKTTGRLRAAAARAFGASVHRVKITAVEFRMLVGLLEDPEESVVRTAADLLAEHPFKEEQFATLARLASGASLAARRFALGKMAELDSSKVVKTLLGHLDDSDYAGRTAAQAALKQIEGAHATLVKELLRSDDERKAWVLADIVAARADAWKRDQTSGLVAAIDAALERNDRLYAALLHVANQVAAAGVVAMLDERGAKLFREKKFDRAIRRLAVRIELPEASDETRFLLALARLRATRRDLGAIARKRDEALELLATLDRGTFPLAERLRKARLSPEELFYIGFNFAEDAATRDTATTLLGVVAKQSPRSKVGRAARNKLTLLERAAG